MSTSASAATLAMLMLAGPALGRGRWTSGMSSAETDRSGRLPLTPEQEAADQKHIQQAVSRADQRRRDKAARRAKRQKA